MENCITSVPASYHKRPLIKWPAHSPDVTPCDFALWNILKQTSILRLAQNGQAFYGGKKQCIEYLRETWENIPMETINKITYAKLQERLKRVIENEGRYVNRR